jgi:uncharacterized membrane protein
MTKGRVEAFSDGVIAIIITIMVLELKVPHGTDLAMLAPLFPVFLAYALSFFKVGIYWLNHYRMIHAASQVGGWVLWANLHLLFWLSLLPFSTGLMGENHFLPATVALYAVNLLLCALAYAFLARALVAVHGADSDFAKVRGRDRKGQMSLLSYVIAIPLAFVLPLASLLVIAGVSLIWLVPDRRFSRVPGQQG